MNTAGSEISAEVVGSVEAADAIAWDRMVGSEGSPFVEHAWLLAMERSRCVQAAVGWTPQILVARRAGRVVGAVPLYLKTNSFGEYVYDWTWADAAQRLGIAYSPKLIAASPYTPVTGPRLLVDPDLGAEGRDAVIASLIAGARELAEETGVGGLHFLFVTSHEAASLKRAGFFVRTAFQYHWRNAGYRDFDDFLGRFRSKRRRAIRRERRLVAQAEVRVDPVCGADVTTADLDAMYGFYASTCARYVWGRRYLNRQFFDEVHRTMPERIQLMLARDAAGEVIAGTFAVRKGSRLYGRYWGASRDISHLHFEACYYRAIEYAIAEGIEVLEPGAGGDHKYARGFEPVTMYSAHWLADRSFSELIERHVERESVYVGEAVERLTSESPIRR